MKTPEEIKKGLECCKVGISWATTCAKGCPYLNEPVPGGRCEMELLKDALALIQQLEAQVPKWISVVEQESLEEDNHAENDRS